MSNPWFRLYHEWDSDPKVQSMPEVMQRRLIMLFCSKCRGETLHETDRAFHWRISETELAATKALFIAKGFIEGDWQLVNWNRRQFISDSSTDRVRKYRRGMKQDETLPKQPLAVTVTPPDTDTDTDTEAEQKHKRQKISRAKKLREARNKPPCKTDISKARHKEFKAAIGLYWKSKNPGVEMPWGAPEGQALEIWLRESPNTSIDQFTGFLRHRFKSDANHTERPSVWIRKITSYANEPLDRFGTPKSLKGNFNGKATITDSLSAKQAVLDARRARRMADEPDCGGGIAETGFAAPGTGGEQHAAGFVLEGFVGDRQP